MEAISRKKILCLHGYRQNEKKFKTQTGALRKILKSYADFYFISAPHLVPDSEKSEEEKNDDQRGWWFTQKTRFSAKDVTDEDDGFNESLKFINEYMKKEGPFDGILGFSQGASLVSLICSLKCSKEIDCNFKFVVIISGFKSLCRLHARYYEKNIDVPSLHVIGDTDRIIDRTMSDDLAAMFVNAKILRHCGGHFVPGISALKRDYIDFITSQ